MSIQSLRDIPLLRAELTTLAAIKENNKWFCLYADNICGSSGPNWAIKDENDTLGYCWSICRNDDFQTLQDIDGFIQKIDDFISFLRTLSNEI